MIRNPTFLADVVSSTVSLPSRTLREVDEVADAVSAGDLERARELRKGVLLDVMGVRR